MMLMLIECYAYFIRKCLAFRFGKGSACNAAMLTTLNKTNILKKCVNISLFSELKLHNL